MSKRYKDVANILNDLGIVNSYSSLRYYIWAFDIFLCRLGVAEELASDWHHDMCINHMCNRSFAMIPK